jgi:serine/threonine-protein kinase
MAILSDGQEFNKTYEVERFLGEGAFAEVYRVKHRFLGRQAMKIFKSPGLTTKAIEKQLEEAVLLSQVGHPNIIRVFDANIIQIKTQNFGYFTMEYIASGSLDQFWRSFRMQFMPVETVVDLITQACRGLSVAHGSMPPIIHRDIKPQNLLVGYDGSGLRLKISDFGLAKYANPLTLLVSARGTPSFKAPEVYRQSNVDSRAGDVWALGCTLYLLLTDKLPFPLLDEEGVGEIPLFDDPLLPPSHHNLGVDQGLDQIVLKALSISISDRYASSMELLADLEKWHISDTSKKLEKKQTSTEKAKSVLGPIQTFDQMTAEKMIRQANSLAKQYSHLSEAADLMEQAFNKWPSYREQYAYQVTLWRKGIIS